jgi:hypothetical protein
MSVLAMLMASVSSSGKAQLRQRVKSGGNASAEMAANLSRAPE